MIKVAQVPLDVDLSVFSRWLMAQGVAHRIVEEQGGQVILMEHDQLKPQIELALDSYLNDAEVRAQLERELGSKRVFHSKAVSLYPRATPKQAPVVFACIVASIVIALLTDFGQGGRILRALLIVDPFQLDADLSSMSGRMDGLLLMLGKGDLWRLVTPDFIHFNIMHITFNLLMIWILGGQLEIQKGSAAFLALAVFVSVVSNVAQLLDGGYLFGGLSGVAYGLVGYCWVWKRASPNIFFPEILFKFSLVWLVLGYTPVTEWLGLGRMANSAHLYGLLSGFFWALVSIGLKTKKIPKAN